MAYRITALVAAALLVGCVSVQDYEKHYVLEEQFEFACASLVAQGYDKVDCAQYERPLLVMSKVVSDNQPMGGILYGFTYNGEPYIFVNPETEERHDETIVHETAHYILWQAYGDEIGRCESESAARHVGAERAEEDYSEIWRWDYNCTFVFPTRG